jgi:type IV pilus modification protein PilV
MMAHRISTRAPRREAGFSLIEALIALLVVAFGLLGIASFQYTLSQASDVAKQRTEATRIAQREIDRLRSFGQRQAEIVANPDRLTYVEDVIDSNGPQPVNGVTTNTAYSMTTTVGVPSPAPASGDRYRWINVVVEWADRTGQAQSVRLATVISDGDPSDLGPLGVTRRLSATLRPKNRNINVPYPAVNVATCPSGSTGGCSAFVPPPGNVAYVFDNVTGNVVQSCALTLYPITAFAGSGTTATATIGIHPFTVGRFVDVSGVSPTGYSGTFRVSSIAADSFSYTTQTGLGSPTLAAGATARWALIEGIDLATLGAGASCTTLADEAYLLSGYVRFVTSGTPNADDIINTRGDTFDLLLSEPLRITNTVGDAPAIQRCYAQRQRVVATPNVRGETIANNGYSRVGNLVTITTNGNHSFIPGVLIAVTGTSDYRLQGQFEVISVPDNRHLTYAEVGADITASGGRVELIQQLTLAETDPVPVGYNSTVSTFVAYTCVVTPNTTSREWWGRLDLRPETDPAREEWDTSSYRVCRYTADYNGNGLTNADHPRYYRQVTGTLDNQNFVVIPAAATCPTDTTPTFTGNQAGNFNNTNTAAHQPTPSDSPGEPASPGDSIDME